MIAYETGPVEHTVLITIDRPEARNSADLDHFKALREAWERFDADADAWVAVITGVGDAFFTGADLKTYVPAITKLQQRIVEEGVREIDGYRLDDGTKAVLRGAKIWKPIIAAVNGFCTAGGMEMLGGVDIRVACPEAQFAVMEPKRGLFAGGGTTVRLPRQIPFPQAMELLLCADLVPASRALEMGLLNAVVPREELMDAAWAYAAAHHRERAAGGAGHQAERLGGPRDGPPRRVPQRGRDLGSHLLDRGRGRGSEGVRGEARAPLEGPLAVVVDPRATCIIGDAIRTWHPEDVGDAGAPEPLVMWDEVAREAAGPHLGRLDAVDLVYCHTWQYDDPPRRLAERLGVEPRRLHYSGIGGTTPQQLVQDNAERIRRGELDLVLVAGAESLATQRRWKKAGERYPYSFKPAEKRPFPWEAPFHPAEVAHEVFQAWLTFAIFDNARRARLGVGLDAYREQLGEQWAPFTRVAAANPEAWFRVERSADEIIAAGPSNRMVGYPYTKYMVSIMDVDMAAALVLASHETADALGVPADQRVYLRGTAYAEDPVYVAEHPDLWRSPAMETGAAAALRAAGAGIDDVAHLDLYSCFASSVNFARDALGPRGRRSSGLHGHRRPAVPRGAGSDYLTHSIATMARRLREDPGTLGLVSGVGMHMTKHAFGVYSTEPGPACPPDPVVAPATVPIVDTFAGDATVAAYSVVHGADGAPEWGVAVCDVPGGRCYARLDDPGRLAAAETEELVGSTVTLVPDGAVNRVP